MLLFPAVTSCGNRSRNFISEQTNLCFPWERTIILRCTLAVFNVLFSAHMTEISMGKAKWVEASRKGTEPQKKTPRREKRAQSRLQQCG